MKNIYITDLDHTFLKSDLSLSDYTQKIWNSYAKEAILSVATARTYKKTMQFLEGFVINAPMILLDGALVATTEKKIIDTKFISKEVGDAIIEVGAGMGIYPFVLALDTGEKLHELFLYDTILNRYQKEVLTRYTVDDNLIECTRIEAKEQNFKVVYMGEEQLLRALEAELKILFKDTLKYILAPEAYVGCWFLTILHKDADKAQGIVSVSEYLGFDVKKLTVFGDNFNDLGMFALAGTSVAVNNAQKEVKTRADVVLQWSNDEDGIAKYLQRLRNV